MVVGRRFGKQQVWGANVNHQQQTVVEWCNMCSTRFASARADRSHWRHTREVERTQLQRHCDRRNIQIRIPSWTEALSHDVWCHSDISVDFAGIQCFLMQHTFHVHILRCAIPGTYGAIRMSAFILPELYVFQWSIRFAYVSCIHYFSTSASKSYHIFPSESDNHGGWQKPICPGLKSWETEHVTSLAARHTTLAKIVAHRMT